MTHSSTAGDGAPRRRHLRIVDDEVVRAAADAAVETVRERALTVLTARPRTAAELTTALLRGGGAADVVAEVVERLTAVGLVDDAAYARAYAEREAGRRGPRAVVDALQRRGIDPALAREVAFQGDADDVRAAALAVGRTALPRWRGLDTIVVERRLAALLARRGYSQGLAYAVVRELCGSEARDDDGPS
jgi:regulatory protein